MKLFTIRPFYVGCLVLLALSSGCAGTPAITPVATPVPGAGLEFKDCQLSSPGAASSIDAHCTQISVYEDQVQKTGRKISLSVAMIPAVSKSPQPDPVFMLAGGPGQSAQETFPALLGVFERLHQKRTIVLVDQRGTGQSNPLKCSQTETSNEDASGADLSPDQQAEELKACLAQIDADPRLYTTSASVEDLEEVRQALGFGRINLVGISYGTRYALAYQRQYPQAARTVTLDSVDPLDWELGPHNPANAQRALDMLIERCGADPACQAAFPSIRSEFQSVLDALDKEPVILSVPHPTSGEMTKVTLNHSTFATTIQILLYAPESSVLIPLLIHTAAARGDYSLLAAQYLIVSGGLGKSISEGLYLSVLCAEDAAFYSSTPSTTPSYLPDHTGDMVRQCQIWPHAQVAPEFKQPVKSDIPTLLLTGEADPITPPANAEQVARLLSNSLNLVVPGLGHNIIYRGCIPKIVTSFIETGSEKGLDTSCTQDIRPAPFMINFSGSQP